MPFQATIPSALAIGKPGTLYDDSIHRITAYALSNLAEAVTAIGCVFSFAADQTPALGGDGAFAGILISPDSHYREGFGASLAVPPMATGAFLDKGRVFVATTETATTGAAVQYNTTTGAIAGDAPATLQAGFALLPNARFFTGGAAGDVVVVQID